MFSSLTFLIEKTAKSSEFKGASKESQVAAKHLHELLVAHYVKHPHLDARHGINVFKHPDGNGRSPQQLHDHIRNNVLSKAQYDSVHEKAKGAAHHIRSEIEKNGHSVEDAHWTSKPGDMEKTTSDLKLDHGKKNADRSDIMVIARDKDKKKKYYGRSLKVTETDDPNVTTGNLGAHHFDGLHEYLAHHRKNIHQKYNIAHLSRNERKHFFNTHPEEKLRMKADNLKALHKSAEIAANHLKKLPARHLAHFVRHEVLGAEPTPLQKAGHYFSKTITHYDTKGNVQHTSYNPHEKYGPKLDDHEHLGIEHSGSSVYVTHKGKRFAKISMKYRSQSAGPDQLSATAGAYGKHKDE